MAKRMNEYASCLDNYDRIPKAVLAAIAFSFAIRINGRDDDSAEAESLILNEWVALHQNGIVPQAPKNLI